MGMNKRIKVLTNSGYKYEGEEVDRTSSFIILNDNIQGRIEIPLVNISFLKEIE